MSKIVKIEISRYAQPITLNQKVNITCQNAYPMTVQCFIKYSPTSNCQLHMLSGFGTLFHYFDKQDVILIMKEIANKTSKLLFLCDIKEGYYERFKQIFSDEDLKVNSVYKSTNGSEMRCIIFNISKYKNLKK